MHQSNNKQIEKLYFLLSGQTQWGMGSFRRIFISEIGKPTQKRYKSMPNLCKLLPP